MKPLKILPILGAALCAFAGCEREGKLTETGPENVYGPQTLPQGNHDYDSRIVDMFESYSTLFLYKYVPHDLYYAGREWTGGIYDPVRDTTYQVNGNDTQNGTKGYFDTPADEQYVGEQLDLVQETLLDFYTDEYLSEALPQKVYLLDSLYWDSARKGRPVVDPARIVQAWEGGDFIAFTWGAGRLLSMTPDQKRSYKNDANRVFLSVAVKRGMAVMPSTFETMSNYSLGATAANGIIAPNINNAAADWKSYLNAITSTPLSVMEAEGGMLHPSYDTAGLIRRKYDIVITYFTEQHRIDLQAIGDTAY